MSDDSNGVDPQVAVETKSTNFNPIPWAIAIAILVLAVPNAYKSAVCPPPYKWSFSPKDWFTFDCPGIFKQTAVDSGTSKLAYAALTLARPMGYVYYEITKELTADSSFGALKLTDGRTPKFSMVKSGDILRAFDIKGFHERPFKASNDVKKPSGSCFLVMEGTRVPMSSDDLSGWLPVQESSC